MARIVIVEEDPLIRALVEEWLGAEDHEAQGRGRIEALAGEGADLLIVDVLRPRHGGCAALHRLQAAYPHLPIIAISSHFVPGSSGASAARALGVRRIVGKPFTRNDLLGAVREVLGQTRR